MTTMIYDGTTTRSVIDTEIHPNAEVVRATVELDRILGSAPHNLVVTIIHDDSVYVDARLVNVRTGEETIVDIYPLDPEHSDSFETVVEEMTGVQPFTLTMTHTDLSTAADVAVQILTSARPAVG